MRLYFILSLISAVLPGLGIHFHLYGWGAEYRYTNASERVVHEYLDLRRPEAVCSLICVYEDMTSSLLGGRKVPPPGVCADYAYLISQQDVVDTFIRYATPLQKKRFKTDDLEKYFSARAGELIDAELRLYPESRTMIERLFDVKGRL